MDVLQGSLFMSAFINTFVSAIVGALAAVGTTWYLSYASCAANLVNTGTNTLKADEIEVDRLIVGDVFTRGRRVSVSHEAERKSFRHERLRRLRARLRPFEKLRRRIRGSASDFQ